MVGCGNQLADSNARSSPPDKHLQLYLYYLSLLFKKKEDVPFSTATAFRFVKHRRDFTFEAFIDSSKP
jgi:hypothetical protein